MIFIPEESPGGIRAPRWEGEKVARGARFPLPARLRIAHALRGARIPPGDSSGMKIIPVLLYFIKRIVTANKLNNAEITIIINNTKIRHASPKIRSEKPEEIQSKIKKIDPRGGDEGAVAS